MDRTQALRLFSSLNVWRRRDQRAPHKPLLVLLALARMERADGRWLRYAEVDEEMRRLLEEFGPSRRSYHPEYPFGRLRNDGVWEFDRAYDLTAREGNTDPRKSDLLAQDVSGGFPEPLHQLLHDDPSLRREIAQLLLDGHFPESLHADLLDAVGFTLDDLETARVRRARDPRFRVDVLRAYEHRCSVCGFDVVLDTVSVGLDAAHIRWHQAGGPAEVSNGLALCALHHRLFDRGAFTVDDARRVVVSERSRGGEGFERWLLDYHGRDLRRPLRPEYEPRDTHLAWHEREVFRRPGRRVA